VGPCLAFPDNQNSPAARFEITKRRFIAPNVALDFSLPERPIGFWFLQPAFAGVTVPEAAVNKNYLAPTGEYEVRFARQCRNVKSVAISESMSKSAENHLRLRVPTSHGSHVSAATLW
jgi:hypothetical protein